VSSARPFLEDLALVLCVAAVTSVVFRRLRQPAVLGYLLAGLIIGPYIPIPLFADHQRIEALAELGVVLVMFSVGLDFSVRRLARLLPTAGLTGLVQISLMVWSGYLVGQAFGWSTRESLFTGAIVAISSTMIVAKAFSELGVRGRVAELVFGVLVVQDLAAVLLIAVLSAVATGGGASGQVLLGALARLAGFLAPLVIGGFLIVPRTMRMVARLGSPETLLVASIGLAFALALLAQRFGYSVALGAFLAGSLVSESGEGGRIEHLVAPVRDMFAAIFFVAVGMLIDPQAILAHWAAVLALTALVLVGQVAGVSVGAFLGGASVKTSLQAGMSLAQIGEFSFIIAGTGVAAGAVGKFLYPIAVAVAVLTSFATPFLIRSSERVALAVDRRLPRPLQTFVSLYATWLAQLRRPRDRSRTTRLLRRLAIDVVVIALIGITTALLRRPLVAFVLQHSAIPARLGTAAPFVVGVVLSSPFLVGMVRSVRALGRALAAAALPEPTDQLDLAKAPRRALVVTLQLSILLVLSLPLLALVQPFVSPWYGAAALGVVLAVLGVAFWRSAANLDEHARAGAQVVLEALASQAGGAPDLGPVRTLLPGLGDLTPVTLDGDSPAVGKTLAELNLRGLTGATVIAITRGDEGVVWPTGHEKLRAGDVLALTGTEESIDAARRHLTRTAE
jgi:CPA2 family monovalent cation:H+ antiporter-2